MKKVSTQKGKGQPPKKTTPEPKPSMSMFNYQNIHTGTAATHPGILKAKANKAKADSVVAAYKIKAIKEQKAAIKMAKVKPY